MPDNAGDTTRTRLIALLTRLAPDLAEKVWTVRVFVPMPRRRVRGLR